MINKAENRMHTKSTELYKLSSMVKSCMQKIMKGTRAQGAIVVKIEEQKDLCVH